MTGSWYRRLELNLSDEQPRPGDHREDPYRRPARAAHHERSLVGGY